MSRIAKMDYFAGVFLTTILKSSKTVPMFCEASDKAKRIVFETDLGAFNVYIKYSASRNDGWDTSHKPKKKRAYWNVSYTESEYDYLKNQFCEEGKTNLIATICTDEKLKKSWIAILPVSDVLFLLKPTTDGGNRIITISRTGRNHTFDCWGVGPSRKIEKLQSCPYVNHLRFFEEYEENTVNFGSDSKSLTSV